MEISLLMVAAEPLDDGMYLCTLRGASEQAQALLADDVTIRVSENDLKHIDGGVFGLRYLGVKGASVVNTGIQGRPSDDLNSDYMTQQEVDEIVEKELSRKPSKKRAPRKQAAKKRAPRKPRARKQKDYDENQMGRGRGKPVWNPEVEEKIVVESAHTINTEPPPVQLMRQQPQGAPPFAQNIAPPQQRF